VIFAESVGSCTDIVATVLKPLTVFRPEAPATLSVVADSVLLKMLLLEKRSLFEPEVEYIFRKQIEEASLVLLNKSDLLSTAEMENLVPAVEKAFGSRTILPLEAANPDSVARWLRVLDDWRQPTGPSMDVDYEIYASGEAMMGWLDEDVVIRAHDNMAGSAARELVNRVNAALEQSGYPIGHVKWLINEETKLSLTGLSGPPLFPFFPEAGEVRLLLNARVQVHPTKITEILNNCISMTSEQTGAHISVSGHSAFQPGYPRPEHRMA